MGSGVGQSRVVLLGARGRPLLGDGSALLRTCLGVVIDADAGEVSGATISVNRGMFGAGVRTVKSWFVLRSCSRSLPWHGPRL